MYGRKNDEEIKTEETKIWECTSNDCKCWLRDNFKSSEEPTCPICKSEMQASTKILQVINNPSQSKK
jgi:hypothetical protein